MTVRTCEQSHVPRDVWSFLNHSNSICYKSLTMVLILESCSLEESCAALGYTTKVLFELRERLRDWLKLQPHLPQGMEKT